MYSEHESIQPSQPNRIFAALRDVCAALYPEERNTRLIVADAGLDERQVAFSSRAQTNWHNILAEAIRGNRLDALLDVVRTAYPTNQPLQVAITSYHQFIAAGGHLDAPAQLPAGVDPYDVHGLANPYLGLRAFRYEDRVIYAGRDAKIREALEKLTEPGKEQAVLFVTGASGSGKSSFVQAGLLPRLQEHYQKRHKQVRIAIFRPRDQPLANLDDALSQLAPNASRDLAAFTPVEQINVLIIDQFEEVFTQAHLPVDAEFFQWLQEAPAFQPGRTHIIATVRSDYLNELFNLTKLYDLNRYGLNLRTMTVDELSETIQRPLQECFPNGERRFEPALVQKLAQDASLRPTLLPLLQVTLQKLWKQGSLKLAAYTNLTDAIQERAEEVYLFSDHINVDPQAPRPARDQQELMGILLDLIHVAVDDTDRRDVRQPRTRRELEQSSAHRPRLIEELVNARLLSAASETRNGEDVEVIDIIHESLIDNWGRLRNAIEEQRQQLQRRARFKLWLGEWLRNGRQDGYLLLTDMQLAEARALVEERDIEVQGEEAQALYRRSVEWREAEREKELQRARELAEAQRQRARVFRNGVVVASLLFLLAAVAAGFSYYLNSELSNTNGTLESTNAELDRKNDELNSSNKKLDNSLTQLNASNAQLQQTIAETQRLANISFSRHLAAQSTNELSKGHYEPAILFALLSGHITDTLEAFSSIRSAIANPGHSRLVFYGHMDDVTQATWNHDESKILTSSYDGTARIWDAVIGKQLLKLEGHTDWVFQAIWNHDESKILTSSSDETARIWDATTGKELVRLEGHTVNVERAIWNHDESKILTRGDDDTVRIWNATTGKELLRLEGRMGHINQAIWNHDDSKVLTCSDDGTTRIWDSATGKELLRLEGHTSYVQHAIWNRDESKILTGSALFDATARVWDATSGKQLLKLVGHKHGVEQVVWNHDETKILTNSTDGTARIWDANTGTELLKLVGHTGAVTQATWNHNESKVLTQSEDGTIRIWDTATGQQLIKLADFTGAVTQAAWSHDESKILASSEDGTTRIWDIAEGVELVKLKGGIIAVSFAIWNKSESKILTNDSSTPRIWDAATGTQLVELEGHTGEVYQVTWSKNESKILTNSNNTASIWDATTGKQLFRFEGHTNRSINAVWNYDESKILTNDGSTVNIWDTTTGIELVKLEGHTGKIDQATWNHDGSKIFTTDSTRTIWGTPVTSTAHIWDAITGQEILRLEGHTNYVWYDAWNLDESKILTHSEDGTARIWDATTGIELVKFEGHTAGVTQATWNQEESKVLTGSGDGTARIWDATTGIELVKFEGHTAGVTQATWNQEGSKVLTHSEDGTTRIWDVVTGNELVRLEGQRGKVDEARWNQDGSKILTTGFDGTAYTSIWDATTGKELLHFEDLSQAIWNQDESRILTSNYDGTVRIWEVATGKELVRLEGQSLVQNAIWNRNETKILTSDSDGTVRVWYTQMKDLLAVGCNWTPRNFTWAEWSTYMAGNVGNYRPTCPNAPIPPDAIAGIQDEVRQLIRNGEIDSATQRLTELELNGWLQVNGQFKNYSVDVDAFVAEVSATATAAALPPTATPTPVAP